MLQYIDKSTCLHTNVTGIFLFLFIIGDALYFVRNLLPTLQNTFGLNKKDND